MQTEVTRRDFFAAHAPVVPQWFKPSMPPKPIKAPYLSQVFGEQSDHPLKHFFKNFYDDENDKWIDGPLMKQDEKVVAIKKDVADHITKLNASIEAINEWERKEKIERLIQWRWFFADEMLK
jgi:hypothetical protein